MLIQTFSDGFNHRLPSEITPLAAYQGRREYAQAAGYGRGGGYAGKLGGAGCAGDGRRQAACAGGRQVDGCRRGDAWKK